jgi:hypothetical protein
MIVQPERHGSDHLLSNHPARKAEGIAATRGCDSQNVPDAILTDLLAKGDQLVTGVEVYDL